MNYLNRAIGNQNQWWKFIVVILGLFVSLLSIITPFSYLSDRFISYPSDSIQLLIEDVLFPFLVFLVVSIILIRILYKRSPSQVINGRKYIRFNKILSGMLIWGLIMIVPFILGYIADPSSLELNFNLERFIPVFLVAIIVFPIQAGCEEFLFRGYLTQVFFGWTKSKFIALIIPSVIFGAVHLGNPEINEYGLWPMMVTYIGLGMIFGLVSLIDGGIELAIGAHIIQNIIAAVFVSYKSSALEGLESVFHVESSPPESVLSSIMGIIFLGSVFIGILKWKYNWKIISILRN